MNSDKYQDLVIKDGKLVGEWEKLYKNHPDPWMQSTGDQVNSPTRELILSFCSKLREKHGTKRTLELGCGLAHLTEKLHEQGFTAMGTDIAQSAISIAKKRNSALEVFAEPFNETKTLFEFNPDIIIMSQLTWYILDDLDVFLSRLRNYASSVDKPVFLLHALAVYEEGVQKMGAARFTNLEEILIYFDMSYLFSGYFHSSEGERDSRDTLFLAQI